MSVRYSQYVLPDPESVLFRPSREQLRGVVEGLSDLEWLKPEDALTESDRRLYTLPSQVAQRLDVPTTDLLHLWLAGGPPGRYPEEFVAGDAFGPTYCEDIAMYDSPVVAMLPRAWTAPSFPALPAQRTFTPSYRGHPTEISGLSSDDCSATASRLHPSAVHGASRTWT